MMYMNCSSNDQRTLLYVEVKTKQSFCQMTNRVRWDTKD